jgi:hypothetical protein
MKHPHGAQSYQPKTKDRKTRFAFMFSSDFGQGIRLILRSIVLIPSVRFLLADYLMSKRHALEVSKEPALTSPKAGLPTSLSVVVPTFGSNRGGLARCLTSVRTAQIDKLQILLVEDSESKPQWLDTALAIFSQHPDCTIEVISLGSNLGPSACRNRAIQRVVHDQTLFLDWDDYVIPENLKANINFLAASGRKWLLAPWSVNLGKLGFRIAHPLSFSAVRVTNETDTEHLALAWEKRFLWPVHSGLIKSRYLSDFPEGIRKLEDLVFWIAMLDNAGQPLFSRLPFAVYQRRVGQVTAGERTWEEIRTAAEVLQKLGLSAKAVELFLKSKAR